MRVLSGSAFDVHPAVVGRTIATVRRRLAAFACDLLLIAIPSIVIAVGSAALSLYLTDPEALRALRASFGISSARPITDGELITLGRIAPLLVRAEAVGLPPAVAVAVQDGNLRQAGEILSTYTLNLGLDFGSSRKSVPAGTIYVDVMELVPGALRGAALFGTAAFYFTLFTAGRRGSTPGKRLMRIEVIKLDGRPLTIWESFERFGGYLVSLGTLGIGLLDLWREPHRRLAHDRLSNTIVVARQKLRPRVS